MSSSYSTAFLSWEKVKPFFSVSKHNKIQKPIVEVGARIHLTFLILAFVNNRMGFTTEYDVVLKKKRY